MVVARMVCTGGTSRRTVYEVASHLSRANLARQARFRALAPVSGEYRMKVLHSANNAVAAHIFVCLAIKVVGHTLYDFLGQADAR
jgi:hypothetical protein